jgi:hypothetical protein
MAWLTPSPQQPLLMPQPPARSASHGKPDEAQRLAFTSAIANTGDANSLGTLLQMALADTENSGTLTSILSQLVARTQRDRTVPATQKSCSSRDLLRLKVFQSQRRQRSRWSLQSANGRPLRCCHWLSSCLKRVISPPFALAIVKSLGSFDAELAKATLLRVANADRGKESSLRLKRLPRSNRRRPLSSPPECSRRSRKKQPPAS